MVGSCSLHDEWWVHAAFMMNGGFMQPSWHPVQFEEVRSPPSHCYEVLSQRNDAPSAVLVRVNASGWGKHCSRGLDVASVLAPTTTRTAKGHFSCNSVCFVGVGLKHVR